jgi:hypothetical protein
LKYFLIITITLLNTLSALALPGGSATCAIDKDYDSLDGAMNSRTKNNNKGAYNVTSNLLHYGTDVVELTISGPDAFIGLLFTVVDEAGNNVGTFVPENGVSNGSIIVHECNGTFPTTPRAAVVTHGSSFVQSTSYTLFWIPPQSNVGKVYVLGYLLKGPTQQEFFRFVRDDDSAISLHSRDVFTSSFE